ncbi:UNVERIFIED_CONTAM: hypothetical protein NY100_02955 [Prevotella sp. 15_C9]
MGGGGSIFVLSFCRRVLRWLSYDVAKGELLACKRSAIGMQKVSYWHVIADLLFSVFFCADCQWVANRPSFAFLLSRHAFPSFPFPLLAAIVVVPF